MNRWRVGEDRGSKETDGCPLTTTEATLEGRQQVQLPSEAPIVSLYVLKK
jgi:hypothetical protein